jgi:phosphohistidine phosphatase
MKLHFLRHADAIEGMDDEVRPLSVHGKKEAKAIGLFFKNSKIELNRVYSSPLLRAMETAKIVATISNEQEPPKMESTDHLRNEAEQTSFDRWISKFSSEENNILLVGHAPSLAKRVRKILGMSNVGLDLPTAGLVGLEFANQEARLLYFVTPDLLGAPGRFAA